MESTGTEGDENIGSAREAFEPRERRNNNGGKIKKIKQIKENRQASRFEQDSEKAARGSTATARASEWQLERRQYQRAEGNEGQQELEVERLWAKVGKWERQRNGKE